MDKSNDIFGLLLKWQDDIYEEALQMTCDRRIGPYPCCSVVEGDCLELMKALPDGCLDAGQVRMVGRSEIAIVSDPPYGIGWKRGARGAYRPNDCGNAGIIGDEDTSVRDEMLSLAGDIPSLVFGSFYAPFPALVKQVLLYHKPSYSGLIGATTPFRRDAEPIFLLGKWPKAIPVSSSVFHAENGLNGSGIETGHPHTKPLLVMMDLITACPFNTILDPFCGSGTTLIAAKKLGRHFLGFEISPEYCEIARDRLARIDAQPSLFEPKPEQLKFGG